MSSPMDGFLYSHKGIRAELAELERASGALPLGEPEPVSQLSDRVARFRRLIKGHNDGEEAVLWPALEEKYPQISIPYTLDHRADEGTFNVIDGLLAELGQAPREEWAGVAQKLSRELTILYASMSQHVDKENTHLVPLILSDFDVAAQGQMAGQMVGYLPQDLMPQLVPMVLRALEMDEKVAYATAFRNALPPERFRVAAGWVKNGVSEEEWSAMKAGVPELAVADGAE